MSLKNLTYITEELTKQNVMPKHLEVTKINRISLVNAFDSVASDIISNGIMTGTDTSLTIATLKALTEYYERSAFLEGYKSNNIHCQTDRSDGFAAFPTVSESYKLKARRNALNEAIERYSWATWWDNHDTSYSQFSFDWQNEDIFKESIDLLREINDLFKIDKIQVIKPHLNNHLEVQPLFVFCELENNRVISGGACGLASDLHGSLARSIGEVFRHALALNQIITNQHTPKSFYEKRLALFGSHDGYTIYKNRLSIHGKTKIHLPELSIDTEISHKLSNLFYVHRCLFKNQPPFIGGELNRFCL